MAISFGNSGATTYLAGTPMNVAHPTSIGAGDMLVLIVGQKPSLENSWSSQVSFNNWLVAGESIGGGYGTTLGADTGNTRLLVYYKVATGSESGNESVDIGITGVMWGKMLRFTNASKSWSIIFKSATDDTAGSVSASFGSTALASNDMLVGAMCIPTDVTTPAQFSAQAFSASGNTFGTLVEVEEQDSSLGNDIGGFIVYQPLTTGTTATLSLAATAGGTTTNVRGPLAALVLREVAAADRRGRYYRRMPQQAFRAVR